MTDVFYYRGREQTLVKHFILKSYLERFAHIVGNRWNTITYVDGFSGPWNIQSEHLEDSSFYIALQELRKARETLAKGDRRLQIRCYFIERELEAYAKLKKFADTVSDVAIETRNAEFEDVVDDVVRFVRQGGPDSFPFIFIDPTGWTGFAMRAIKPLLELRPGEVLINFMTGHIKRFIESPQLETQQRFEALFGSAEYKTNLAGLSKQDREDALVSAYCEMVKKTGGFEYVCNAMVLDPAVARTRFHLIYATRSARGVEVFKQVEKKAMPLMERARAAAQRRRREEESGQSEMFDATPRLFGDLRQRYLVRAHGNVEQLLRSRGSVDYDEAWARALAFPLVWESDLKNWIKTWGAKVRVDRMASGQRVPKRGQRNTIVWIDPSCTSG